MARRPFSPFLAGYCVAGAIFFVVVAGRVESRPLAAVLYGFPWVLILFLAWQRGYLDRR